MAELYVELNRAPSNMTNVLAEIGFKVLSMNKARGIEIDVYRFFNEQSGTGVLAYASGRFVQLEVGDKANDYDKRKQEDMAIYLKTYYSGEILNSQTCAQKREELRKEK